MAKVSSFFETEEGRTILVALERFVRGSATGLALYGGGTIALSVVNGKLFRSPGQVVREALSVDTLRFSAFLGAFPDVYKLAHDTLRRVRPGKDGSNSTMAGAIAGLTMFIESGKRRRTIALFLLARAAGAFMSTWVKRGRLPRVRHLDTLVFCLCTGFIVYAAALDPELLPDGYYRSILRWSRGWTDKGLAETLRREGTAFVPCDVHMHPGSCHVYTLKDTLRSWPSFFKMYLPINLVPVLLFKYKELISR
ncbi:transmembrane protein 135-like [Branchiostoma floridae x Branchiostoma japonicum]